MNDILNAVGIAGLPTGSDDLRQLIAEAVREASSPAREAQASDMSLVLELDRTQFARAVYRSNSDEAWRVGDVLTESRP